VTHTVEADLYVADVTLQNALRQADRSFEAATF